MISIQIKMTAIDHATDAYNDCDDDMRTAWMSNQGDPSEGWINAMGSDAVAAEIGVKHDSTAWDKALKLYDVEYIAQWDALCDK